jgi:hypothetical protein
MAKFKCLVSGTVVNFEYEHDIADMRKHPQYEEVVEKVQPVEQVKVVKPVKE